MEGRKTTSGAEPSHPGGSCTDAYAALRSALSKQVYDCIPCGSSIAGSRSGRSDSCSQHSADTARFNSTRLKSGQNAAANGRFLQRRTAGVGRFASHNWASPMSGCCRFAAGNRIALITPSCNDEGPIHPIGPSFFINFYVLVGRSQ